MPRSSYVRSLLTCVVLCALLALSPRAAADAARRHAADARLRALYTEEWNWRQKELARSGDQPGDAGASDRFPKVDAASQQARLALLDEDAGDAGRHPFDQLSAEEKVNAQVFRTSIRALANDVQVQHLRSAVQQRHVLLDRVHAAPGLRDRRRPIAPISAACATCRATSTSRSPTCALASRAATPSRACRSSAATRRSSRT